MQGNTFVGGITPDMMRRGKEAVRKTALSMTWKERHAKGVPAICTRPFTSVEKAWLLLDPNESEWHTITFIDCIPSIIVMDEDRAVSRFCNFRYKQSWLDKKGGEHA